MSFIFNVYADIYDKFMSLFKLDSSKQLILEIDKLNKNCNILDFGGGTGVLANQLLVKGHSVTIIDKSKKMLKQASKKNKNINYIHADILEINFKESYDIIILRDVLHHIKDQELCFKKITTILKPDGLVLIQDFNSNSFQTKMIFLLERMLLEKIKPISADEVEKYLRKLNCVTKTIVISKRDYLVVGSYDE